MSLKKIKIISVFTVFILCTITHFLYDLLPNPIFSIFFPVNESIWEHMKMLYTSFLLNGIIEYFLIKKYNIKVNNFLFNTYLISIISIILYLTMYLPFYYTIGNNKIVIFTALILDIIICEIISYFLLKKEEIKNMNFLTIILIILSYIIFTILTYYPLDFSIFNIPN